MVQWNGTLSKVSDTSRQDELKFLKAYLYGLQFFRRKNLSIRHLKVIIAVEMLQPAQGGCYPGLFAIAAHLKLRDTQIKQELRDLVEGRFVHEIVPKYGDCEKLTYKLGPLGGSFMKKILDR